MLNKKKIIVVLPAFNEEGKIGRTVLKVKKSADFIDAVLVVDDGSDDNTKDEAKNAEAIVISHSQNRGVGAALRTGFEYAQEKGFDLIVVMGGDDQDETKDIKDLLNPLLHDGFDFIQGSRYMTKAKLYQPLFRLVTTTCFSIVFTLACKRRITDGTNGFRAFKTSILKDINLNKKWLDAYELEPYLMLQVIKKGFNFKEVGVRKYWSRSVSYSKMTPIKSWWSISRPMIYSMLGIRR